MKLFYPDIKTTERGLETHVFTTQTDGERAITVNIEALLGLTNTTLKIRLSSSYRFPSASRR